MADTKPEVDNAFDSPTFGKDGSFYVDKPVGSMSISPCGRDVVLASRQGLHVVDLDSPWTPPRHLQHLTPWEVADVQWSPFASRDYWVASTSNQKALVWNLAMSTPSASIEHVLHAHTRAITDINFSAHHPDLLATCAVDSFVHCWDLRFPARPAISFCDWFAGATQVKWNRQDSHIVASSHDKTLRIWDDRKGAHPLRSIVAHSTKIYGLDWNRADASRLLTCSLDKTIKVWNYESELDEPERTLTTAFPVWRARHTPFGQGLLVMPQRNDFSLHLFDRRDDSAEGRDKTMPCVKQFTGHENHVKEFLWRARGPVDYDDDQREWQLVTWGSDSLLRLHRMTDADMELVGHKRGNSTSSKLLFTRRDAPYKTFRENPGKSSSPDLLSTGQIHPYSHDLESMSDFYRPSAKSIIPSSSTALSGWMSGGFVNSRVSHGNWSTTQKDLDPITWMKGVKIGKREPAIEQSLPSIISPNLRVDKTTDEFESLGDEITHVGTKFSRVEFSRVEVQKRFLQLSLHGPWGTKHSITYLNCRIEFPMGYPQHAHPVVTIEKTATLPDETVSLLQQDSKKLGLVFQSCQKPSFEALIRFLQGEQTIDDLTAWAKDDPDSSVYDFAAPSDGSSSDDEDDLGAFVGKQDNDLGMTGSGVLSVSNANVNVPLARTCGAAWSHDGRLVCFFSQKEEVSQSLVGSLGFDDFTTFPRSKRRGYEGLGKFYPVSSTMKSKTSSLGTLDSDDSDSDYSSDDSDLSSSSSWLSTQDTDSKARQLVVGRTLRPSISPFQGPEKLADETRRSNASISGTKSRSGSNKCFISLYDFTALLPSKRALSEKYVLSMPEACLINAQVAREHGLLALAEAWSTIDMVLKDAVPLKAVSLTELEEPGSPKVPTAVIGVDAVYADTPDWRATVKWGSHPFGTSFLVEHLFDYFARIGDIQMLATMACIFYCPAPPQHSGKTREEPEVLARSNFRHTLSEVLTSPSVMSPNRVDYFPSLEVAASVLHPDRPAMFGPPYNRAKVESNSLSSSLGAAGSDTATSLFPPVVTPPTNARISRRSSDQAEVEAVPISASPERLRWAHRSGSQIASALSSSFHRPLFTASASSSPPNVFPKKKISPIGSLSTGQIQLPAVLPSRAISRSLSNTDERRSAERSMQGTHFQKELVARIKVPRFQVHLKNQDQFYQDGYSDTSLLKIGDEWRYEGWRRLYADLLGAWGLWLQRAEILKYNHSQTCDDSWSKLAPPSAEFTLGKRKPHENFLISGSGDVQFAPLCVICGPPVPGSAARCFHHQQPPVLYCLFCEEAIHGRAQPCLNCGHVIHAACWAGAVQVQAGAPYTCLSGCGCRCGEHIQVSGSGIENNMKAMMAPPAPSTTPEAKDPPNKITDEVATPWEDVAYESLVRNLGGFRRSSRPVWNAQNLNKAGSTRGI